MSAPYTVSYRRPCDDCNGDGGVLHWEDGRVVTSETCGTCDEGYVTTSRWAYATLEEVRGFVREQFNTGPGDQFGSDHYLPESSQADDLPESGGTIKLPDGSEIVVEPTTRVRLLDALNSDDAVKSLAAIPEWPPGIDRILAAWNAEYGIGEGRVDA